MSSINEKRIEINGKSRSSPTLGIQPVSMKRELKYMMRLKH